LAAKVRHWKNGPIQQPTFDGFALRRVHLWTIH
jgi:hypothetical protein